MRGRQQNYVRARSPYVQGVLTNNRVGIPGLLVKPTILSAFLSGNVLGNGRTIAEISCLGPVLHTSQLFSETRKRHAAAYRERRQLIGYGRTLNVEPIGSGPADTGR